MSDMQGSRWSAGSAGPKLPKAPTGIRGFDEITDGGLPRGRATLVAGSAGAGKTLFAIEFLVHGALEFGEPGVLMAFEESDRDLAANVASIGWDLVGLERTNMLVIDSVDATPADVVAAGTFNLEGLFIRLAAAVDSVGAKRVVLDSMELLFGAVGHDVMVRAEIGRLFRWLKERGLTTVVTGEQGTGGGLTRYGFEEYVSDCVVALDHRVDEELSIRRLRVVKYRGSFHGTNEYPFLIGEHGFSVLPVTTIGLNYTASEEQVTTGLPDLDEMLGGDGIFRGSTMMITGAAGTGKTAVAAAAAHAACGRGERCLFSSFEESPSQLLRNMRSVGIDLDPYVQAGLLRLWSERASAFGLESHVVGLHEQLAEFGPSLVVLDGLGSLNRVGSEREVISAVTREIGMLKAAGVTAIFTALSHGAVLESTTLGISSLTDTWLQLRNVENDGERNRLVFVMKSRGMAHSNQVREFTLSDQGPALVNVMVGPSGILTGSARNTQLSRAAAAAVRQESAVDRGRRAFARHAQRVEAQIAELREQLETDREQLESEMDLETELQFTTTATETESGAARTADFPDHEPGL